MKCGRVTHCKQGHIITHTHPKTKLKTPWLVVRKRTIPTERPPLVSEVSANFCG
jgi:hypothetical protein